MHIKKSRLSSFILFIAMILSSNLAIYAMSGSHEGTLYKKLLFKGDHIVYKGKTIKLGPRAFFIDGELSKEVADKNAYVFNSIKDAVDQLTDGNESNPMTLYIAPWVYWVDDPDDPAVRIPKEGSSTPFGMEINCEWLRFFGLSDDPYQVILASNRGQTMGAKGNFTMFNLKGDGVSAENITFGNYCNIDLEYPAKPELGRKKRGSAIVQAQLIFSNGDKVMARNTNFVSRLNLAPFWGSKRTLFDHCHFESTDDALNGSAVYLNCTLDLYSSKPFGHTVGTGAVFLNCDFRVFTRNTQYLVKGTGPVSIIDCRFEGPQVKYLGWRDKPDTETRYYQHNVNLNEVSVFIDKNNAFATVDMTGEKILNAYRFQHKGEVIYNTYNLLRGNDDWDPMEIKSKVGKAEKSTGQKFTDLPTLLQISPTRQKLETGKDSILLSAKTYCFGNFKKRADTILWSIDPQYSQLAKIQIQKDGTCLVVPTNTQNETRDIIIEAKTTTGLESAAILTIAPSFLEPPAFTEQPTISYSENHHLKVNYSLDMEFADQSLITWYRCKDQNGKAPIKVAVSRFNKPMYTYPLTKADIGYYIMVQVEPKHIRCNAGESSFFVYPQKIKTSDVKNAGKTLTPNLENMPVNYQPKVLPGFWTMDSYAPEDTHEWHWEADNSSAPYYYGPGINGAANDTGLVQNTKGARLRYLPVGSKFGDMEIQFTAVPAKTAGQGFSSARSQYMDIGIKMDVESMNGYALRLIRTTKYGNAIDFILMKYENGLASPISESISASCYRPNCKIVLNVTDNTFTVDAVNIFNSYFSNHDTAEVKRVVHMKTEITPNVYGGVSFQHTGSVHSGATLIKDLSIQWK